MSWLPFLSYVFVVTFTPGPNNIMALVNANQFGFRQTLRFILGVGAGFAVILLLCSFFNLWLNNFLPRIQRVMNYLGAAYMLYLAYLISKSGDLEEKESNESINSFLTGMLLQFFNVKGILYGITVISTFIIPYYRSPLALLLFTLFLVLVVLAATSSWALFGAVFKRFLDHYRRPFNYAMALLLVYSAYSIF